MVPLRGPVNTMTPPSPYADLMAQRIPLQTEHAFSTKLDVYFCIYKRDNFSPIYQMVPPRGSLNPTTPPSPYGDLMAQRRPLQTKHTFSTKLDVHFCIG